MYSPDAKFEGDCFKVAEHRFQVPMPNSPLLSNIYALAPVFWKSQGYPQKYLFSHFGKGVCCCHGNGAG